MSFVVLLVNLLTLAIQALSYSEENPSILRARAQSVVECLSSKGVQYSVSTSSDWKQLIAPYNLRLVFIPAVVTLPTTSQHVSDSVVCAAASDLKVQAKSGGHSYASFAYGGKDGHLVVNLQYLQTVKLDTTTNIATVGGGVRLGNLALGIYNQGKRALPHGTCLGVGVGGHFLHGGYGHSSRAWGLSLDTIVALDVVLANGTLIQASTSSHPDIFFAMRGAGDSFGIVTNFYLQTKPAPTSVINFSVDIPAVYEDIPSLTNAFLELQKTVFDPAIVNGNLSFGIYTEGRAFNFAGWCIDCDVDDFKSVTLPAILKGFPRPESTTITPANWTASLRSIAGNANLQQPITGYDEHDTFYVKSVVSKTDIPLTAASLTSFFTYIVNQGRNSPSPWFSIINLYGGAGSQINIPAAGTSAYSKRDTLWVFQNYGYASKGQSYDPATTTFIDNLNRALTDAQPDGEFTAYLNYIDPELTQADVMKLYYGSSTYNKLVQIKNSIDPNNVFWNPQAITATLSSGSIPQNSSSSTSRPTSSSTTNPASSPTTVIIRSATAVQALVGVEPRQHIVEQDASRGMGAVSAGN
ncbi:glucooligosaccharide oxidase [Phlyctema vagabunda]|uniref:Glucooligosaccharide oxidase n=1 Tax=Phlyctema vagabunda TaxID=108571 RepID=A0ABR4PYQ9_9HELO